MMKTLRWAMLVFVSMFLGLGIGFQALAGCPPLQITSPNTLPSGTVNQPYNYQIQTSGGQAPIIYQKISGSLPPGLNLSSSGVISGTPTTTGTYTFTIKATDSCPSGAQTAQKTFSLTIKERASIQRIVPLKKMKRFVPPNEPVERKPEVVMPPDPFKEQKPINPVVKPSEEGVIGQ